VVQCPEPDRSCCCTCKNPGSQFSVPGSQFLVLSSWFSVPGSQFLVPGSQFSVPGSRFLVLGSWFSVLSSRFLVPGSRFLVPGSRFLVPGSQFSVLGSRFSVLGSQFSTTVKHRLLLLVALLAVAACSTAPVDPPTPSSPSPIPASPTADVFTDYWTRSGGAATLGEPVSAPIFLDGTPTKVYRRGLIAVRPDGLTALPLPAGWVHGSPAELEQLPASPWRATLTAPADALPLTPVEIRIAAPGYHGRAVLYLYDGRARRIERRVIDIVDGVGTVAVQPGGATGAHSALLIIDGAIAGGSSHLYTLDAETTLITGQERFDALYPMIRRFMEQCVLEYDLDGIPVRGYRSPDNPLLWLRDHTYQARGMRRAVRYTLNDPLRWDAQHRLVRRPYTIDTWDFAYGPTTTDPTTGKPAPRHWIDDQTIWGIFHGDNTGLAYALELLARIEARVGDPLLAHQWRAEADGIMERLNALSWNGRFYTHFVPLERFDTPGVDESAQLSLSNAYALNRQVLSRNQGRAIVDEYFRRGLQRGETFAEWYSIDPPFPPGSFGLAGRPGEHPGEYVNGGLMPLVGGELARGAFRYGAERYAFEILHRYYFLISTTGASYLWYYPAGNPGISGEDTLPTDGWGASAMLGALIEGAAGVEDRGALYQEVTLSPRWIFTGDVDQAQVTARYAASDGYVAYRWRRLESGVEIHVTGSGERIHLRVPLPEHVTVPSLVTSR
jgi:hypothetical protein